MPRPHKYLDEIIEYGGEFMARAQVIADMQRSGTPQPLIDRWLQGQELAAELRAQRENSASNSSPSKASSTAPTASSAPSTSAT